MMATSAVFVFDVPRSCSNLFRKLFSQHPQLEHINEPFLPIACFAREGVLERLTGNAESQEVIAQIKAHAPPELADLTFAAGVQGLEAQIQKINQDGKIAWIKDHTQYWILPSIIQASIRDPALTVHSILSTNATSTPASPSFLSSITPVFLIRHPALVLESYYRVNHEHIKNDVLDEQFTWMVTMRWTRILFDYYLSIRPSSPPMLVDAEDVVYRTTDLTDLVCERLGLDKGGKEVIEEWEAKERDPMDVGWFFRERINASKKVERGDGGIAQSFERNFDFDITVTSWKTKYGERDGTEMGKRLAIELVDYEYLKQFKVLQS